MDRHIRMVWFTPVMIDGKASGISTSLSNSVFEAPKATADSFMLSGTPLIPRAVRRITGGIPKMIVANMPGGFPVPKNAMIGIK